MGKWWEPDYRSSKHLLGHAGAVVTYSPTLMENAPRKMQSYPTCIYKGGDVAQKTEGSQLQVQTKVRTGKGELEAGVPDRPV